MSEHLSDDRLVSGAIIAAEMGFALNTIAGATTLGRDAAAEPGCVSFQYEVKPLRDLALEGRGRDPVRTDRRASPHIPA